MVVEEALSGINCFSIAEIGSSKVSCAADIGTSMIFILVSFPIVGCVEFFELIIFLGLNITDMFEDRLSVVILS